MLLYYLFWMLMSLFIHFYIIFGTNLLTRGPAQNCCFLPISEFRRKSGVQPEWHLQECDFRNERDPEDLDPTSRHQPGGHEVGGAPTPWARPPPSWAPRCSTNVLLPPIYTYVPQTIRYGAKNLIPPPQPSVPVRSHLGACSGAPLKGASITEGFYINTIVLPMKCE